MGKHWLLLKLDEMASLMSDLFTDPELFELDEEKNKQFREARLDIIDYLIDSPGALLYEKDSNKRKKYQTIANILWKTVDQDELLDEFHGGRFADNLTNMTGTVTERFLKLQPTFIAINPENTEFKVYFEEAMNAWVHGLDQAALILCFSILEDALKDSLCQIDVKYVYELKDPTNPQGVKTVSYEKIFKSAYKENLITRDQKDALFKIKKKRNNSIHELRSVGKDEVYQTIITTKDIIEHLLGNTDKSQN